MSWQEVVVVIAFLLFLAFAKPAKGEVVYLYQNKPAPFSGYLFDENSQTKAQVAVRQLEEYKKLDEVNKKIIAEQEFQLNNESTIRWVLFIGGAVVGGWVVDKLHD